MIAIKNADGTLVPVADGLPGVSRSVALSLVHSNQKRAEIQLYEIDPVPAGEHPAIAPGQEPFGVLAIKKLPENPFGEVEITATIDVDLENNVRLSAEAEGIRPVSGVFALPGAKRSAADPMDLSAFDDFGNSDHVDLPPPHDDLPSPADSAESGLAAPPDFGLDLGGIDGLDGLDLDGAGSEAPDLDQETPADEAGASALPDLDGLMGGEGLLAGDGPATDSDSLDDFLGGAVSGAPADGLAGAVPEFGAPGGASGDEEADGGPDLDFDLGVLDGLDAPDGLDVPGAPGAVPEEDGDMALPDMDDLFGGQSTGEQAEALADAGFDAGPAPGEPAGGLDDASFDLDNLDAAPDAFSGLAAEEPQVEVPEADADGAGVMALPDLDDQLFGESLSDSESIADDEALAAGGDDLAAQDSETAPEAGFIDDPDNNDWGFDELAEPDLAEGPGMSPAAGAETDFSFGEEALDLGSDSDDGSFGAADFDTAADFPETGPADGLDRVAAVAPARPSKTPARPAGAAGRPAPRAKPERAARPERQRAEAASKGRGGIIQHLMKASIVLFAVSLVELGVYLFLRFNILP